MENRFFRRLGSLLLAAAFGIGAGCSTAGVKNEIVGTVNGEEIRVSELREFLGARGASQSASDVPAEKKKEALDRLIGGRLLAQEARAKGLDNTAEFREQIRQNEPDIWIAALFRKEIESREKDIDKDVKAEAKRQMEADKKLTEKDAESRAAKAAYEQQVKKVQDELISAAKKETPSSIDKTVLERIGKKEKIGDDAVVAVSGQEKVNFGDLKKMIQAAGGGSASAESLAANVPAIERFLDRELTKRSLLALAKKQGIESSKWMGEIRKETERLLLINLIADREILRDVEVTDKEIEATYKEHAEKFARNGKKIPLSQIKEQIRVFVSNNKKRKAVESYVEGLRTKAKITVNESVLAKV